MVLLQPGAPGHPGWHSLSPVPLQICCPAVWVTAWSVLWGAGTRTRAGSTAGEEGAGLDPLPWIHKHDEQPPLGREGGEGPLKAAWRRLTGQGLAVVGAASPKKRLEQPPLVSPTHQGAPGPR